MNVGDTLLTSATQDYGLSGQPISQVPFMPQQEETDVTPDRDRVIDVNKLVDALNTLANEVTNAQQIGNRAQEKAEQILNRFTAASQQMNVQEINRIGALEKENAHLRGRIMNLEQHFKNTVGLITQRDSNLNTHMDLFMRRLYENVAVPLNKTILDNHTPFPAGSGRLAGNAPTGPLNQR